MVKVEYIACIMCGKTVVRNKFTKEPFNIEPSKYNVLQVREQVGGRSGKQGFFNIDAEAKNIVDLWNGSEGERDIAQVLKDRLLSVVESYVKAGIIKRTELRFKKGGD